MRSLALKTGLTVVPLVCLCSLFLVTTVQSSRIPDNPSVGESGVKPTETCTTEDGGCNGATNYTLYPSTGCQPGLVDSGGTCVRSSTFINNCFRHDGYYDPETCTCTPEWPRGSR